MPIVIAVKIELCFPPISCPIVLPDTSREHTHEMHAREEPTHETRAKVSHRDFMRWLIFKYECQTATILYAADLIGARSSLRALEDFFGIP